MSKDEKLNQFSKELSFITDVKIRGFAGFCICNFPDYFFTIPASSTGKYHPQYATGEGGLLRHTQAAVRILHTLLGTETFGGKYAQEQKDLMITAMIIHDGAKKGIPETDHTEAKHPILICDHIEGLVDEKNVNGVSSTQRNIIYALVKSHMGQWNSDFKTKRIILPKPSTAMEGMIHLCDYLASRKILEFNFEAQI
jgi:hypothetical protein